MKMPKAIGLVHFIGIGGIGMSGIAEVLHNLGHRVQGSDQADSANVQRLRDKGIEVFVGHTADNLGDAEVVVVSTAIKKNNPELIAAREKHLPIVRRAEMLAELMRFRNAIAIGGTHGKTTTTSMVATLLEAGNLDPTVINGGIINAYGTNARMGEGEWMVVEADESDGTFLKLALSLGIHVTRILCHASACTRRYFHRAGLESRAVEQRPAAFALAAASQSPESAPEFLPGRS